MVVRNNISVLCEQMRSLSPDDIVDPTERREVYAAAQALAMKMEQNFDTLNRLCLSVSLTKLCILGVVVEQMLL